MRWSGAWPRSARTGSLPCSDLLLLELQLHLLDLPVFVNKLIL